MDNEPPMLTEDEMFALIEKAFADMPSGMSGPFDEGMAVHLFDDELGCWMPRGCQ